jgi:hypothetical protein
VRNGTSIHHNHGTSREPDRSEGIGLVTYRCEGIRSKALPQRESLELIKETLQRWTI